MSEEKPDSETSPEKNRRAEDQDQKTGQNPGRRIEDQIRATKLAFLEKTVLSMVFIFISVSLVGTFLMAPEYNYLKEQAARVQELEVELTQMDQRLQEMNRAQTSIGGEINTRIEKIEQNAGAVIEGLEGAVSRAKEVLEAGVMQERLAELEKKLSDFNDLSRNVGKVVARVDELQKTIEGQAALQQSMAEISGAITNMKGDIKNLDGTVDQARKENEALAVVLKDVSKQDLGAAALLLTLSQFRNAVGREAAFEEDLALMRHLIGDDPELNEALDRLAPYAQSGITSPARLRKEFSGLAGDIATARLTGQDLSVKDSALKRLGNLVKVRKEGADVTGNDADAVVARAHARIDAGDIQGAIAELEKLQGAPADVANPWMQQARGTVAATEVSDLVTQAILTELTTNRQISLEGLEAIVREGIGGQGLNIPLPGAIEIAPHDFSNGR